ncbi:LEAF RUST 10 DISEASE-RESISTANCE LOCUS RECEPTOR-LIKE PROTEIN KINASE-like 1.2 [Vigna radiata var. radiata]|uniref:RING-type E3 ubiquitin transferase n=1 Tax=Vigna radiata var. radiata TaxID=3916 RepID=A0A1S3VPN7_VIGRR|nr:LEAF RUST 10 DISEASE-RESISTANCE LOCUS RECEPTOR-LIKE PROTEIN KINASE-like 1.2 [Vigna radiata var. radiata]
MGGFITLFLICVLILQSSVLEVTHARFQSTKCGDAGPDIHYPYQIKGQHQYDESLPGFELLCKDNLTTIHFPSYGDLEVKSISYDTKDIHLLDPKNCVHHVFLNLNLFLTPFHYFYVLKNYTYLNCSTTLLPPFVEIPCLSAASYHVYTVDPALPVPGSCAGVKTVAIPFAYSPYLSDSKLGLRLTWGMREPQDRETTNGARGSHTSRNIGIGFGMFVFVMAMLLLISTKIRVAARNNHQKEGQLLYS